MSGNIELMTALLRPSNFLLGVAAILIVAPCAYYVSLMVYNLYLHPLSKYPGPKIAAATPLWMARTMARGTSAHDVLELHERYGDVVRVGPDELSYVAPAAWKDIYGYTPGMDEMSKDPHYHSGMSTLPTILNANREKHGLYRRLVSHGFSEKALREQEPLVQGYVELLIRRLREESAEKGNEVDMVAWYNYTSFDIIGELAFGENFECLRSSSLHPWVETMFYFVKMLMYNQAASRLPWIFYKLVFRLIMPQSVQKRFQTGYDISKEKTLRRLDLNPQFTDLISKFVDSYKEGKVTLDEVIGNAYVFTLAGSETTATLLSGATYYLLKNPSTLARVTAEVRSAFDTSEQITFTAVNKLPYLMACLEESLRIYPPSVSSHARMTPAGGAVIAGRPVPGGVAVGVPIYAALNYSGNFRHPQLFAPERWLSPDADGGSGGGGDARFVDDRREAMQPFSVGPRNCVGKNLANVEMRLVLAKVLWHFDLALGERSRDGWERQREFVIWEKPPLWVKLTPVRT